MKNRITDVEASSVTPAGSNALVGRSAGKKWMTLNKHGKYCLNAFICAISGTDISTTQVDYLFNKELISYQLEFKDYQKREPIVGYCLTDLGIETAKHYFPNFKRW
jgi:hypothetical protein